jgi:hypothetical protein
MILFTLHGDYLFYKFSSFTFGCSCRYVQLSSAIVSCCSLSGYIREDWQINVIGIEVGKSRA